MCLIIAFKGPLTGFPVLVSGQQCSRVRVHLAEACSRGLQENASHSLDSLVGAVLV